MTLRRLVASSSEEEVCGSKGGGKLGQERKINTDLRLTIMSDSSVSVDMASFRCLGKMDIYLGAHNGFPSLRAAVTHGVDSLPSGIFSVSISSSCRVRFMALTSNSRLMRLVTAGASFVLLPRAVALILECER